MKKFYSLYIDSSQINQVQVKLTGENLDDIRNCHHSPQSSQVILPAIESLIIDNKLDLEMIRDVKAHLGPGSFTGLRVGVTIAKTISFLLGVCFDGCISQENTEIKYDQSRFDE